MVLDATAKCSAAVTGTACSDGTPPCSPPAIRAWSGSTWSGWRDDATGPMQVVSGPLGRPTRALPGATGRRAGIRNKSLPDLGQQRICRTTTDRRARTCGSSLCIRSMMATYIRAMPSAICSWPALMAAPALLQPVGADPAGAQGLLRHPGTHAEAITRCHRKWLAWFLKTLHRAVDQAQHTLDAVLAKTRFWQRWATTPLNDRQGEAGQQAARRLRGQAHQQQMGGDSQVFAGHRAARHHGPAGTRRVAQNCRRRLQYQLRAERLTRVG